jgi:YggT family protein
MCRYIYFKAFMNVSAIGSLALAIFLGVMMLLFIFRIILTWYPQAELNRFPFILVAIPTEPLLIPMRKIVQPWGGVDIAPIIWFGIFSLLREILLGQQGLLKMIG